MSVDLVLKKLHSENKFNYMGDHRKFKFLLMHLNSTDLVINFFIEILKYKRYQANKIAYNVKYEKIRYQNQLNNKPGQVN
ncbi:Uncharacterised protein [Acholeplasma oculi]|uniref:Uncharacterized protein n=1 Tax=Acholeplasma oculi TaxID=35623 RepID=A0A061AGH8_9MOLU|nr:hypothetical protein [Acholeplasma oculi]CDR30666.1 hypothetical protein Aocu_05930 [Acholeplasma oculi]SKC34621.1 hypothetical protein SAMN02745122_0019 [Acholeplasma oculi]SUT89443.1 Uncharacterised protein [Acholeplasma oculi]SUU69839.1 Uncharacterised protein [Acholeplasma oculi]